MPREEPYLRTTRDITSPRASFPFKKVQGGIETSNASKNNNDLNQHSHSEQQFLANYNYNKLVVLFFLKCEVTLHLNHLHSSFWLPFALSNQPSLVLASCKDSYQVSEGIHNNHLI